MLFCQLVGHVFDVTDVFNHVKDVTYRLMLSTSQPIGAQHQNEREQS